jgi:hypothetical protein
MKLRKRDAGRLGPVASVCHRASHWDLGKGFSLQHPADCSVAVVRIVGPIARDSGPDSFGRRLSWNFSLEHRASSGATAKLWCVL